MARRKKTPQQRESTIIELLNTYTDIEELKDEMVEWRDNMDGANMSHLPKYDEVSEAADTLENAELERAVSDLEEIKDEAFAALLETKVTYQYYPTAGRSMSRQDRLSDAVEDVRRGYERLSEFVDDLTVAMPADVRQDAREALDEIESQLNDLENVSFPGMF